MATSAPKPTMAAMRDPGPKLALDPAQLVVLLPTGCGEVRYHEVTITLARFATAGGSIEAYQYTDRIGGYALRQWRDGTCRMWHIPADGSAATVECTVRAPGTVVLPATQAVHTGPGSDEDEWCAATDQLATDLAGSRLAARQTVVVRRTAVRVALRNTAGAALDLSTELASLEVTTALGTRVCVQSCLGTSVAQVAARYPELAAAGLRRVTARLAHSALPDLPSRVVTDEEFAGLLAHEVVGHPLEADVVLPADHWSHAAEPVAGEHVTVVDDPNRHPFGGFDHEGSPTRPVRLLDRGVVAGRLHSLATAAQAHTVSSGHGRAVDWRHPPIPRMTCTGFVGGTASQAELLDRAGERGIYLYGARGGRAFADGTFWAVSQGAALVSGGRCLGELGPVLVSGASARLLSAIRAVGAGDRVYGGGEGGCGKAGQFPLDAAVFGGGLLLDSAVQLRPLWR